MDWLTRHARPARLLLRVFCRRWQGIRTHRRTARSDGLGRPERFPGWEAVAPLVLLRHHITPVESAALPQSDPLPSSAEKSADRTLTESNLCCYGQNPLSPKALWG